MKKVFFMVAGILATATAIAAPSDLGPPTTGSTANGSWVDVRVTANVVEGIAVNEASPIDFGNLVKDSNADTNSHIYLDGEQIRESTPGRVTYRANTNGYSQFTTRLEKNRIDLAFTGSSGVEDNTSTNTYIRNVRIEGIGTTPESIDLVNGQAERKLTAWFQAYDKTPAAEGAPYVVDYANGNLGKNQKLGYYEGTVRVYAESVKTGAVG